MTWTGTLTSVNERLILFRRHRFTSSKYKDFKAELALCAHALRPVGPPYAITIYMICHPARDIDNAIKPTIDALVQAGVLSDDRHVMEVSVIKQNKPHGSPDGLSILISGTDLDSTT